MDNLAETAPGVGENGKNEKLSRSMRSACWLVVLFLAATFVLLLTLNAFTPLWGDDWYRATPIGNPMPILRRIADEYTGWTGRLSALLTTYIALWIYPGSLAFFNLFNSFVFCLLLLGMFRASAGRWPGTQRTDVLTLFVALFSVWFFCQGFGEAILWKTGAIAYMWITTAAILVLQPFVDLLVGREPVAGTAARRWLLPPLYAYLGMWLENVSVTMSGFMLLALIVAWRRGIRLPRWYWLATAAQWFGTVVLVVAPGNFVRMATASDNGAIHKRFVDLLEVIWRHGTTITPSFLCIAFLAFVLAFRGERVDWRPAYLYLLIGLLFAITMIGSPGVNFGNRTAFVADVYFALVVTTLAHQLWDRGFNRFWLLPLFLGLVVTFGADVFTTLEKYYATWRQDERREQLMAMYHQAGVRRIYLPSMQIPYIAGLNDDVVAGRYFLRDIHPDIPGNAWRNGSYAQYHGFEFALRIPKAYVIYLPEAATGHSVTVQSFGQDFIVLQRPEYQGWGRLRALYFLSPAPSCPSQIYVQAVPAQPSALHGADARIGWQELPVHLGDVAVLDLEGKPTDQYCASRVPLPDYEINQIQVARTVAGNVTRVTVKPSK